MERASKRHGMSLRASEKEWQTPLKKKNRERIQQIQLVPIVAPQIHQNPISVLPAEKNSRFSYFLFIISTFNLHPSKGVSHREIFYKLHLFC